MNIFSSHLVINFILIFFRILFLISYLFVFSSRTIPMKIKTSLSFLLAILFLQNATPISTVELTYLNIGLLIFNELLIAFLIGFAINIILYSYKILGELLSFSAGLTMANIYDPSTGAQEQIFNKFFYIVLIFIFFNSGFLELIVYGLNNLFSILPVGTNIFEKYNLYTFLIDKYVQVFTTILVMAMPFFLVTTLTDIYFGYVTRNSPSFNIFGISFQMKFLMLSALIYFLLPYINTSFSNMLFSLKDIN